MEILKKAMSPSAKEVWIEIILHSLSAVYSPSPSAKEVWIEI